MGKMNFSMKPGLVTAAIAFLIGGLAARPGVVHATDNGCTVFTRLLFFGSLENLSRTVGQRYTTLGIID